MAKESVLFLNVYVPDMQREEGDRKTKVMGAIYSSKVLLLVLVWMVCAAAEEGAGIECTSSSYCGSVSIPFPFGSSKECSLAPEFFINCTNHVPYLPSYLLEYNDYDLQVLSISVDAAELRVSLPVASDCYYNDTTSKKQGKFFNNETKQFFYFGNYSISRSRNVFTTIGCATLGLMVAGDLYGGKPHVKTCFSFCEDPGDAMTGSCNGTGCCRIDIPEPEVKQQVLTEISYFFENEGLNNSDSIDYSPCGYAFVAEKERYDFASADLMNNKLKHTKFPVVLDWSVGNQTCEEAKKKNSSYACKGPNTTCHPSGNRPGYLCKCRSGFQGNPYHHHGCPQGTPTTSSRGTRTTSSHRRRRRILSSQTPKYLEVSGSHIQAQSIKFQILTSVLDPMIASKEQHASTSHQGATPASVQRDSKGMGKRMEQNAKSPNPTDRSYSQLH